MRQRNQPQMVTITLPRDILLDACKSKAKGRKALKTLGHLSDDQRLLASMAANPWDFGLENFLK